MRALHVVRRREPDAGEVEHGGDPASVAFCHEIGLDYVSCSPFRVPITRLAAAQAALGKGAASTA
jgi:pyruvate,orthophosphate dikinase